MSVDERNFGVGVRQNALYAKRHVTKIEHYLDQFKENNFNNIKMFEEFSYEVETHLENIKVFVERGEHRQLRSLEVWMHKFYTRELMQSLGKQEAKKTKDLFYKAVKEVISDLKQEYINELRIAHHKKPRSSFMKTFQSSKSLDGQIRSDEKKIDRLLERTHDLSHELEGIAHAISRGSKELGIEDHFVKEVKQVCKNLVREFSLFFEEYVDVEIQEYHIIKELDQVIQKYPDYRDRLVPVRNRLVGLIKRDVNVCKRLFKEAKHLGTVYKRAA